MPRTVVRLPARLRSSSCPLPASSFTLYPRARACRRGRHRRRLRRRRSKSGGSALPRSPDDGARDDCPSRHSGAGARRVREDRLKSVTAAATGTKMGEPPCNSPTSNWLKTIPSISSRTSSPSPAKLIKGLAAQPGGCSSTIVTDFLRSVTAILLGRFGRTVPSGASRPDEVAMPLFHRAFVTVLPLEPAIVGEGSFAGAAVAPNWRKGEMTW